MALPDRPPCLPAELELALVSQGAEAQVFYSAVHPFNSQRVAGDGACHGFMLKYRPPKTYRHPTLDQQLTKHRTLAEARVLFRLAQAGVSVPELVAVDPKDGCIWMENVDGPSLKAWIWQSEAAAGAGAAAAGAHELLQAVGAQIATLHALDIVHGDLTTSNVLVRAGHAVLIDFGLASQATLAEDKAVDLYVLERAFSSTHPQHAEEYFAAVLVGYEAAYGRGTKAAVFKVKEILKKLDAVRLRGRKRSMVG
ncbi:kinase-like domain-containing protein [Dipodascopsis tothii]|uniref:kinase-like domain-containing protein n=1 Tax=Dipodascopsis tothii TaxID=44089 RepID=UPI0034CD08CA